MANPQKPAAMKLIAGTARADRAPAEVVPLVVLDAAPPPPAWLPEGPAVDEWHRLARILTANRLLTEGGTGTLAILCALFGDIQRQYMDGESPAAKLIAQYRAIANDFGLSPVAQGKVGAAAGAGAKANRFANNGRKPA